MDDQLVEVMSQMRDLFEFSMANDQLRPETALEQLVNSYSNQQLQTFVLPNAYPPTMSAALLGPGNGLRTPALAGPHVNHFASPAGQHNGVPPRGSVHTPSPGHPPSGMPAPAPPMAAQQSQQGSSSANASSNASPNVANKRRRASAVKLESSLGDDDMNGGPTQPKVKASPRVGGKRQKGNGPG